MGVTMFVLVTTALLCKMCAVTMVTSVSVVCTLSALGLTGLHLRLWSRLDRVCVLKGTNKANRSVVLVLLTFFLADKAAVAAKSLCRCWLLVAVHTRVVL